jgi:hypothetical protein
MLIVMFKKLSNKLRFLKITEGHSAMTKKKLLQYVLYMLFKVLHFLHISFSLFSFQTHFPQKYHKWGFYSMVVAQYL